MLRGLGVCVVVAFLSLAAFLYSPSEVEASASTTIILTETGLGTWVVPKDWNSSSNIIRVIGGGGSGVVPDIGVGRGGAGGGGGAYSATSSVRLTPGSTVSFSVGAGGARVDSTHIGNAGTSTWFCSSNSNCSSTNGSAVIVAAGGGGGALDYAAGSAGTVLVGSGNSGGAGGAGSAVTDTAGAGGGGAGGQHGAGVAGTDGNSTGAGGAGNNGVSGGGTGGSGLGTVARNGFAGTNFSSTLQVGSGGGGAGAIGSAGRGGDGGGYGAGGGGGSGVTGDGGGGAPGVIVIEYMPVYAFDQEGFRFRDDDGSEAAASWVAAQDTNITWGLNDNLRFRALAEVSGAGITAFPSLQYREPGSPTWHPVGADDSYPTVMATSSGRTTTAAQSHVVTMPSGIQDGDLLLIIFSARSRSRVALESNGWKKLFQAYDNSEMTTVFFWKLADGSDTATVTTPGQTVNTSHIVYRIRNGGLPQIATASPGIGINTNPPNLDTDAVRNYLWIAARGGDGTVDATAAPSGYGNFFSIAGFDSVGAGTAASHKFATAQSEDPSIFTSGNEQSIGITIAVPPLMTPVTGNRRADFSYGAADGTSDSSYGTLAWNNADRLNSTDNVTTSFNTTGTSLSRYLKGLNFGFDVPDNATITGIELIINRIRTAGTTGEIEDDTIRLVKGGTVVGDDLSQGDDWKTGAVNRFFGSSTEMWGTTWTPADVNATNFGAVMSAKGTTAGTDRTGNVDNYSINVYYTMPSEIGLSPSSHIAASGASTTFQLAAPAGKATTDFDAGRIQDDENPSDGIIISTDDYTEVEWSLIASGTAATSDVYDLRLGVGPHASATNYDVNASWTVGTYSPSGTISQEGYRFRDDDGSETTATWLDAQDNSISWALNDPFRFRGLVDTYNTGTTSEFSLQYKLSSSSTWAKVAGSQPVIVATTTGIQGSDSTTHNFTSPSGQVGDLLLLVFSVDAQETPSVTTGTGWTFLASSSQSTNVTQAIYYKYATGDDNGVITTTSEQSTHIIYRIRYAGVPTATGATGNSTNPNPPSHNAGTVDDYLWIATHTGNGATTTSAAPSGFGSLITRTGGTGGASSGGAHQYVTASSTINPGTFTAVTGQWVSYTIAVPPANTPIELNASANITDGGASTTAQLTAPTGKTSGSDFDAGRIQDDENPADAVAISSDDYAEFEWSIIATGTATSGQTYDLRIGYGTSTALDEYDVSAQVTIGSYVSPGAFAISGTLYGSDRVTPITTGKTIKLIVGTSTPSYATTTTDGSGNWTINIATSTATTTWSTTTAAGNDDTWSGIAYGNGTFVAIAEGASGDHVMYSTNGITWATTTAAGDNDNWYDVTYANGLFVAVSGGGDKVMTSPDGITWTVRSAAGNNDGWSALTYGNGRFVAVSNSGDRAMYSDDGITWATTTAAGDDDIWFGVTYGEGLFVAVGSSTDVVMTSPDGVTWTARSAVGNNDTWRGVAYGNGRFVAVSNFGDRVMTSPDGIAWATTSAAGDNDTWRNVTFANGQFVALASGGNDYVMTSTDGLTWTTQTVADNDWWDVAYGKGRFVGVGRANNDRVMYRHAGFGFDTPITVFVDGDAIDATTLTTGVDATSSITGVNLYRDHVNVMSGRGNPTTYRGNPTLVGGVASSTALDGARSVAFKGDYAYVASRNSDSVRVIDISSSTNPVIVGGVSSSTALDEVGSIEISGNYAYVSTIVDDSLRVLDISNPTNPVIVGGVKHATTLNDLRGLALQGNYAYVPSTTGDALQIIDISVPTAPTIVGGVASTTVLNGAVAVVVSGDYAYVVANTADSLTVIDISSSTNPTIVGTASSSLLNNPNGIDLVGNYIYTANTVGNSLTIIDVSNPASPTIVGSISSSTVLNGVEGVDVEGVYAYMTANTGDSVTVVNIASSTNPVIVGTASSTSLDAAKYIEVRGDYAYVATQNNDSLRILNIAQLTSGPIDLAHFKYPDSSTDSDILLTATTSTTTIDAHLYIPENTTLIAPPYLELSGDLVLRGTFKAERGDVLLTGSDQTIEILHTNTSPFFNFTQHTGSPSQTTLGTVATLDIDGTLSLEGEGVSTLTLRSTTDGTEWLIDASAAELSHVDVKDSKNINTIALNCFDGCTDSGNNTNWVFTFGMTFTGTVYEDAGLTPYTSGAPVKLIVGTSTPSVFSGTSDVDGNWVVTNIATSSGGVTWATTSVAEDDDFWEKVAYGNGIFVAVGSSGDDRVMTSYDGVNWTARSAAGNNDSWRHVAYGNGLFVAVGNSGDRVMTSPDGITWTVRNAAGDNDGWFGLTYGNGRFVAVSNSGDRAMYSDDGINWTATTAAGDDDGWIGVAFGNNRYVALASSTGVGFVTMVSPDGVNWEAQSAAGDNDGWRSMGFGGGLFVAVGIVGDRLMTSPDGVTWTVQSIAGNNDSWRHVTYANGQFIALSSGGDLVATSPDAVTWTTQSATDNDWWGITYGKGRLVAVGSTGTGRVMYSDGGFGENTPITVFVDGDDVDTTTLTTGITGTSTIRDVDLYHGYLRVVPATGDGSVYRANATVVDEYDNASIDEPRYAAISGNRAYVTGKTADSLVTFDISSSTNITVLDTLTNSSLLNGAEPIAVQGDYAYIGTAVGDAFRVVDISSSTNAVIVGGVASTTGHLDNPWRIVLRGDYAYVTGFDSDSLSVIDISSSTNPRIVGGVASSTMLNGAAGIDIVDNLLYVTGSSNDGLVIFDISSSSNPVLVKNFTSGSLNNNPSVDVVNNYAYMINNNNATLVIVDISSSTSPVVVDTFASTTLMNGASMVEVDGRYAYVTAITADTLSVFDISDPTNAVYVDHITDTTNLDGARFLTVDNGYVYMTAQTDDSFHVIDISEPNPPASIDFAHTMYPDSTTDSDILFTATTSTSTVSSNFLIASNATFVAPQNLTLSGNFIQDGTFQAERGNVILNGTAQTFDLSHLNTSSFHDLTQSAASPATTTFTTEAIVRTEGTLLLEGDFNNTLSLRSATDGTQWHLAPEATTSTQYLDVKDSKNRSTTVIECFVGCVDSGNTTNWSYVAAWVGPTFSGTLYNDAGITPITSGKTIKIVVGTSTPTTYTTTSDENGYFSITVATSSGGTAWTGRTAAFTETWRDVAYGNGRFVAVAETGTSQVMYSSDGITWATSTAAETASNAWKSVTYGNGLFVAVGNGESALTNPIMTSPDGINWTPRTSPQATTYWVGVTYGEGKFVAVARSGARRVMTSPDGITWTLQDAAENNHWQFVTYGDGQFVAVACGTTSCGAGSGNLVMSSTDGVKWHARAAAEYNQWAGVTYGDGQFVAVARSGTNRVMTSPDAVTWTPRAAATANSWWRVLYGNGHYVAVAATTSTSTAVMTSTDGITWTPRSASAGHDWTGLAYGDGKFVAVSSNGATSKAMSSEAGFGERTPVTIYVDGDAVDATTLTNGGDYDFTSVPDLDLYRDHVRIAPNTGDASVYRANPTFVDEYDNAIIDQPRSVAISGNYAYIAAGTADSFVTMDISTKSTAVVVDTLTNAQTLDGIESIAVQGSYAYVTARLGDKFHVIDISSSTNATIVGTIASTTNHLDEPWRVVVRGNYAYVANNNGDSLSVIDISSSTNPRIVGGIASSTTLNGATGLDIENNLLYLTAAGNNGLVIFDLASSTNPILLGNLVDASFDTPFTVDVQNNYAYIASYTNGVFFTIDVSSSTSPFIADSFASSTILGGTETLEIDGRHAYIGANTADTFTILDISSTTNATYVYHITDATNLNGPRFVTVVDGYAYVAAQQDDSFHIVDVHDPNPPAPVDFALEMYPDSTTDGDILFTATTSSVTVNGDFYVSPNATFFAPKNMSLAGDLIQRGTFEAERGEVILTGTSNLVDISHLSTSPFFDFTKSASSNSTTTFTTQATLEVDGTLTLEGDTDATLALRSSSEGTQWRVAPQGMVAVSYLDVKNSYNVSTTSISCGNGCTNSGSNTNWTFSNLTIGEHADGQPSNVFSFQNQTDVPIFAFSLNPNGGSMTISSLTLRVTGVSNNVATTSIPDLRLYRDINNDGNLDGTDIQVGGAGFFTLSGSNGTIVFSTSFVSSTTQNFIVTSDTSDIDKKESLVLRLYPSDIVGASVSGSVSSAQHHRHISGAGGSSAAIGGAGPAGQGVQTGGGDGGGGGAGQQNDGANIVQHPNFFRPTGQSGSWNNGANALISDGTRAQAPDTVTHVFQDFGFSVPTGNTIVGIEVKLDTRYSGSPGVINVDLSWNGNNYTSPKATPTLTSTDAVYTLGSPSDTWGRSWVPSEFSNANFRVRVGAGVSLLDLDGIEVRIYHQTGGGGDGGGGAI